MATVTALVHTKNSAKTLAKCLDSVKFADEVLVIDMESQDDTREIAKKHGATVLSHKDVGYVEPARQFALSQVKTDWTLIVDADEEVPESLAHKLKSLMEEEGSADSYFIARKNIVFDKWIEHTGWWPDYQFRFFKSGTAAWPEEIHAQPKVTGTMVQLEAREEFAIIHHNYQTIEQFLDRMNRYTSIEVDRGQHAPAGEKTGQVNIPAAFSSEFARRFFADEGYLDGTHGLALSYLQSMYQVVVELKRWQKAGFPEKSEPSIDVEHLRSALRDLQYWTTSYSIQRSTGLQRLIWTIKRKFR